MKKRVLFLSLVLLTAAAVLQAGERAALLQPKIEIEQIGRPGIFHRGGPFLVEYRITVENRSSETISLKRLDLRSIGDIGPYTLRSESRPFKVSLAPGATETVTFRAMGEARGGVFGAMSPLNLRGVAWFQSEAGNFAQGFTYVDSPKESRTDG